MAQIIDDSDITKLQASDYNGARNTAIIIHGVNGKPVVLYMLQRYVTGLAFNHLGFLYLKCYRQLLPCEHLAITDRS